MPWPMTLGPVNEAVRRENRAEKTLIWKIITITIWEVMKDVRIVLLSKKHRFCESRRKINRTYGYVLYFLA
jgi:hypothetical protein